MADEIIAHHYHKANIHGHFVIELNIYTFKSSKTYPDNIKYRMICLNLNNNQKVLLDNHKPKGHHYHINDKEFEYSFSTKEKLFDDFNQLVLENLGIKI